MRSLERSEATCTSRVRPVPSQLGAPHLADDLLPAEHHAGALREQGQQVELLAGQLDGRTVHADLAGRQLDAHGSQAHHGLGAPGGVLVDGAPADGVDAGEQFARVVRLDHVVVRAQVQSVDAGTDVGAGGDHDDGGAGELADLAADLVAVLVGQSEVEQDDAEAVAVGDERLESLLAVARVGDVEAVPGQDRGQGGCHVVVVLDEQQSHPGSLRFIGRTLAAGISVVGRSSGRVRNRAHARGRPVQ